AGDADQRGDDEAGRVVAGLDRASHQARDEADQNGPDDAHANPWLVSAPRASDDSGRHGWRSLQRSPSYKRRATRCYKSPMLEKLPDVIGHALHDVRAGLDA